MKTVIFLLLAGLLLLAGTFSTPGYAQDAKYCISVDNEYFYSNCPRRVNIIYRCGQKYYTESYKAEGGFDLSPGQRNPRDHISYMCRRNDGDFAWAACFQNRPTGGGSITWNAGYKNAKYQCPR